MVALLLTALLHHHAIVEVLWARPTASISPQGRTAAPPTDDGLQLAHEGLEVRVAGKAAKQRLRSPCGRAQSASVSRSTHLCTRARAHTLVRTFLCSSQ